MDGAPISCPLWLRAAAPGKLSLYLSVFYEMGDTSSVMTYRTLRLHFNIEVGSCYLLDIDYVDWLVKLPVENSLTNLNKCH